MKSNIERKTLVTYIVAGFVTLFVFGLMVFALLFQGQTQQKTEETTNNGLPQNVKEQQDAIVNEDLGITVKEMNEENDYSNDVGYDKLPNDFIPDETNITGTVYSDEYLAERMYDLLCDLSNKTYITVEAVTPLSFFAADAGKVGTTTSNNITTTVTNEIQWLQTNMNGVMPEWKKIELKALYCETENANSQG